MEKKKNTTSEGVNEGDKKFKTKESRVGSISTVGKTTLKAPNDMPKVNMFVLTFLLLKLVWILPIPHRTEKESATKVDVTKILSIFLCNVAGILASTP